jgi:hypothetical protein
MRTLKSIRWFLIAVLLGTAALASAPSFGQVAVGVAVNIAPPELPVYDQPVCPGDGYIWTPGYWAWGPYGYYWVPGTWVLAPEPGFFWTPGYWAWRDTGYFWIGGYWGPVVGFYGGVNYGFGYFGHGFVGGRWDHDHFFYNRSVTNVNVTVIHNTYNETVVNNYGSNRVSFNGGRGGIDARPTAEEEAASRERHIGPVAAQVQHENTARDNRELRASVNNGRPPIAATPKPGDFKAREVVPAREGGAVHTEEEGRNAPEHANPPAHASDLQPQRFTPPNTGDAKQDAKYQQQQQKLAAQQAKERQQLQQKQEKEHATFKGNDAQHQQMEARHQQQTQQLAARQAQQAQHMQQHQQPHQQGGGKPR